MNWTVERWHKRFIQQASWTASLRRYLYGQIGLRSNCRVLDVGCGTGALASDFEGMSHVSVFGLDIDLQRLEFARGSAPSSNYCCADGQFLPFDQNSFDFAICHYLLLWLMEPLAILKEMTRVTRSGGVVLAIAEPDYASRIDAPSELAGLGKAQTRALKLQGANPKIGRLLPRLFSSADLRQIQFGSSGFQTHIGETPTGWELEWQVLAHDLSGDLSAAQIEQFKQVDRQAWRMGARVLWVPTFYAFGTKS